MAGGGGRENNHQNKYVLELNWGAGDGAPLQCSCLEDPMDGGAWWAAVHGVAKSRTRLSNFTFTFHFHALEKEMATHSSVLAWRIPGTGEPGGLPSMGSQSRTRLKRLSSGRTKLSSHNLVQQTFTGHHREPGPTAHEGEPETQSSKTVTMRLNCQNSRKKT